MGILTGTFWMVVLNDFIGGEKKKPAIITEVPVIWHRQTLKNLKQVNVLEEKC